MKTCHSCKESKPHSEYNKNKGRPDGLASTCRECMKIYRRAHYAANKEVYVKDIVRRRKVRVEANTRRLFEYLSLHPCVDCGISDPRVLEFDHRDEKDKSFSVSDRLTGGWSWGTIEEEIKKCDVRCANCHRIRTQIQFGFLRSSWSSGY